MNPTDPNNQPQPQQPQPQQYPQPPQQPAAQYPQPVPGRTSSIIGFIFAFVGLSLPGLILSIIGLRKSSKAGHKNILGLLGVIFNGIGLLAVGLIIWLVVISYQDVRTNATDSARSSNAYSVLNSIESYQTQTRAWPDVDPTAFRSEIKSKELFDTNDAVFDLVSSDTPSAEHPAAIKLAYCGGDTAQTALGMSVSYWNADAQQITAIATSADAGC